MGALSFIPIWAFAALGVVILLVVLFRTMNQVFILSLIKKNIFYVFIGLFVAIFVISIFNIQRTHDFDLTSLDGVRGMVKVYAGWLGTVGKNVVRVTGYAINQDWVAQGNSTSSGGG
ncbi:MAG: hypothetical protein KC506_01900 [Nanoarchaeota archaeon]|nr:hypothetical protein [Nanoarchaeota archaeon]